MTHAFTNELINETSPYLLQHAHNPVEWHSWGEHALKKARQTDKPILVSIGYSACHWCHVMERESFENLEVAGYMNEHFINIKIDREERPDLDQIYMDAVQSISGNGGWPLNVFLTTEAKPFYGGTYFPSEKAFNRPSWKDILFYIADAWEKRRDEIEQQAENLLQHINASTRFISKNTGVDTTDTDQFFNVEKCKTIRDDILKSADVLYGGFGNAPKFPQTFTIQYLFAYGHYFKDEKVLQHAEFSLRQMLQGGIYDHLAGGLARYSTDAKWLVPHFEKMLYDNALLVSVLCDAFQITADTFYKAAIEKTLKFLINEMKHSCGGFYAALDADSEGVEGSFYIWDKAEIDHILGIDSEIFCNWYGVTKSGNWEYKNILHITETKENFTARYGIDILQLNTLLSAAEKKLLAVRNKRIRPLTDDKILLGWNALLLTAFCKVSAALGSDEYKHSAVSLFNFLNEKFSKDGQCMFHTFKNNVAKHPAYLDDYSYFIQACILLQEITGDQNYLIQAKRITIFVMDNFLDEKSGFFFYTHCDQKDIIVRKIEIYDNAIPSGNSILAENLFYLSIVFDERKWWDIAMKMLTSLSEVILKYPTSFGIWANLFLKQVKGFNEIVIAGKQNEILLKDILKIYLPSKVLQTSENEKELPLLKNKIYTEVPIIYLCRNHTCYPPALNLIELKKHLKIHSNNA